MARQADNLAVDRNIRLIRLGVSLLPSDVKEAGDKQPLGV